MWYRNVRTGELYESAGRDSRLEAIADDPWLPVPASAVHIPLELWVPPPTLGAAVAAVPDDEMETP